MKKRLVCYLLSGMVLLPLLGQAESARRIVSLDMCTDWMLATYANPAHVVALSPLSRQEPVAWLDASAWTLHDGSLEQILQLKPDLVISGEYNALMLRKRLQTLGVRVEVMVLPKNLAEVSAYEKHFLTLLGLPASMVSKPVEALNTNVPRQNLLLLGPNGLGTGRATFENDIIERAGWRNYLRDEGHIRLDLEQVVTDPPQAILWAAPASKALANRFAEHTALQLATRQQRWLSTDFWRWQCPGPWTWDLIRQLQP